jgi:hypothetical protein
VSTPLPDLFSGLVDDAAMYPPGSASLAEAIKQHRHHRAAWYAKLVGPLLVPASVATQVGELVEVDDELTIGVLADGGLDSLRAVERRPAAVDICQVELAVAKRGEDPQPGLAAFLTLLRERLRLPGYAEIPLTWGLLAALDAIAEARDEGVLVSPKFRTGGLAAELFPTPIELAAVICACRDRGLRFKLTAGLHHAIRRTDPETGFVHHGFLNVLVATAQAAGADGTAEAEVAEVAATLASTDPVPLIEAARRLLSQSRPLWAGFGSCSIAEPLDELSRLGLLG